MQTAIDGMRMGVATDLTSVLGKRGKGMATNAAMTIHYDGRRLLHADVVRITRRVFAGKCRTIVLLDLDGTPELTTAALAKLILLRRALLKAGRDLRLTGLHGRAEMLYELYRLARLLPRDFEGPTITDGETALGPYPKPAAEQPAAAGEHSRCQ